MPASPSPDNSSLASAVRSLSAGASHAERSMGLSGSSQAAPRALPPEPLNEFQRFVSATTGHTLAIFGASLFNSMPASFGPLDHGPAPGELIVGTDDELRIRIWGQVNFSADLRVSREGEIYIPKVGAVHLAGLPFSVIAAHLREAVDRVYRNYELSVDMGEIHSIQIYVTGHAHRPGEYTVSALSTLVDTVFTCGGPSSEGTMRHILLKREGKVVADFDLYALLVSGDKTGDMQLEAGDVLFISPVGPQVALFGSVRQSAIFELRGAESIAGLLDAAGGTTALATNAQLSLERIENHSRTAFVLAADNEGLATPLADGDILRVDPILPDYRQTVTLRGAVANPGRFRWHEGMRLSELMPEKDALVKRNYWWRRTQLGLPAPEFASLSTSASSAPEPASLTAAETSASSQPKPVSAGEAAAETNWNNAIVERLNPATMTTTLLSFGVGKLVLDHDQSQDLTLMPGDVITIFSQAEIPIPIREQTKYVTLQGEFVHPGVYSVGAGETLNSVVARAGGLTPQAYLYAASFTRRSTQALEQHRLNEFADQAERQLLRTSVMPEVAAQSTAGRQTTTLNRELVARIRSVRATGRIVLNMKNDRAGHYDLPDMSLEDGDEIVVPFTPETVEVEGAVFNPHAFLFQSGATVGAYLRLAGGPSRYADRKRILVLRADGTVISRIASGSLFARGLDNLTLNPGDGILVPEKNLKLSPMNLALLWTQALSQTSMSALEANALTR